MGSNLFVFVEEKEKQKEREKNGGKEKEKEKEKERERRRKKEKIKMKVINCAAPRRCHLRAVGGRSAGVNLLAFCSGEHIEVREPFQVRFIRRLRTFAAGQATRVTGLVTCNGSSNPPPVTHLEHPNL